DWSWWVDMVSKRAPPLLSVYPRGVSDRTLAGPIASVCGQGRLTATLAPYPEGRLEPQPNDERERRMTGGTPASTGDVYIEDSARYARRTLEPLGWPEHRLRVCLDACEQHHAFRTRWCCPTRWSFSAVRTSSKWCPSSCAGASPESGLGASG